MLSQYLFLVPWLCLGTFCLRLCRLIAEAEPPGGVPMQSIETRMTLFDGAFPLQGLRLTDKLPNSLQNFEHGI
jgi:hypothetical protein